MAIFYPSYQNLLNLRVPLEPGELFLINYLKEKLDDTYEVYVQPFLNGDRPDVVILKREYGLYIIEVKDWRFEHYKIDERKQWHLKSNNVKIKSPLNQCIQYKKNIIELHIPGLLEEEIRDFRFKNVICCAVYFHNETQDSINNLIVEPFKSDKKFRDWLSWNIDIFGRDSLNLSSLERMINARYEMIRRQKLLFSDDFYHSIKRFLQPTLHTKEEGEEFSYSPQQLKLIQSYSEEQRIKGVVGSGKTTVLAARAVNAHIRTNSRVLILTYNITLKNYIHDKISRVKQDFDWSNFYITNYHEFITTQMNNLGIDFEIPEDFDRFSSTQKSNYFENNYYSNVKLFEPYKELIDKFKVIIIDEIQDYKRSWMDIIKNYFLEKEGEYVAFGDEKQNIYGNELENKDIKTNIRRKPTELKHCFRSEKKIKEIALGFQKDRFSKKYDLDTLSDQVEISFEKEGYVNYINLNNNESIKTLQLVIQQVSQKLNEHPNNIAVLGYDFRRLRELDALYRYTTGEKTNSMLEMQEEYYLLVFNRNSGNKVVIDGAGFVANTKGNPNIRMMLFAKLLTIYSLFNKYKDNLLEIRFNELINDNKLDVNQFLGLYERFKSDEELKNESAIANDLKRVRDNKKYNFWFNRGTIKIATIHSFKGWEANTLFLIIEPSRFPNNFFDELIYTGITRSRQNLIVINYGNELYDIEMRKLIKDDIQI